MNFFNAPPADLVRSCNPGQPSPAWEALHCYEGDQRCTGHGRAFVAWHGTEAAETKTRKHPMFKTKQIWKPGTYVKTTVSLKTPWSFWEYMPRFRQSGHWIEECIFANIFAAKASRDVCCCTLPVRIHRSADKNHEVSGNHRRWTTPGTTYRVSRALASSCLLKQAGTIVFGRDPSSERGDAGDRYLTCFNKANKPCHFLFHTHLGIIDAVRLLVPPAFPRTCTCFMQLVWEETNCNRFGGQAAGHICYSLFENSFLKKWGIPLYPMFRQTR